LSVALGALSVGIGALIGYVTNYTAIKMLFRPHKPVRIGKVTIIPQGVILKEQPSLAKRVGEVVRDYILSEEEIKKILASAEVKSEIERFLDEKISLFLDTQISELLTKQELAENFSVLIAKIVKEKFPMFASFVNEEMLKNVLLNIEIDIKLSEIITKDKAKELIVNEVFDFLEKEVPKIFLKAHIEKIVEEKVASFEPEVLEEMLFSLMKKHFGFINMAGAFLGGIIGFIQYLIITNV